MSKDKDYRRMLASRRWRELRAWKLRMAPLCEACLREGKYVAAVDVHHRREVLAAATLPEMEALCFDPWNLEALCPACHTATHRERRSHSREAHQRREREGLARWADMMRGVRRDAFGPGAEGEGEATPTPPPGG